MKKKKVVVGEIYICKNVMKKYILSIYTYSKYISARVEELPLRLCDPSAQSFSGETEVRSTGAMWSFEKR